MPAVLNKSQVANQGGLGFFVERKERKMKKAFFIILIILAFTQKISGNENSFQLYPAYIPEKIYHICEKVESTHFTEMQGDETAIKKHTPPGVKFPLKTVDFREVMWVIETGKKESDGSFPLTAKLEKIEATRKISDKSVKMPNPMESILNLNMHGKILSDGTFELEKFEGKEMNEVIKKQLSQLILRFIKGPQPLKKPVKLGEDFTQQELQKFPSRGGRPVDFMLKTKYQPTQIKNGKAHFKTYINAELASSGGDFSGDLSGDGEGKMIYDIGLSFVTYRSIRMEMKTLVKTPEFILINNTVSDEEMKTIIDDK